jgi:uncharacterized protein (DUF433 family)
MVVSQRDDRPREVPLAVSLVVEQIAHGATVDEVLNEYPDLERADVQEALEYAAWVVREEVHPA